MSDRLNSSSGVADAAGIAVRVSVIIPTWNRNAELRACLQALARQEGVDTEIIVLDDASTDGTCEMVADEFPAVHLIRGARREGPSFRRNEGIRLARGEFVLFLDSDITFPTPCVIANMVRRMDADPAMGAIGGEMAAFAGETHVAYGKRVTPSLYAVRVPAGGDDAVPCDYLATCCCMVRRSVVAKAGGFDARLTHGEDMDLGLALKRAGYCSCVARDCSVNHHAAASGRSEHETLDYCRCRALILRKHYGMFRTIAQFGWDSVVGVRDLVGLSARGLCGGRSARAPLAAKCKGLLLVWRGYGALFVRRNIGH